jgi:heme A synthase
MTPRLTIYVLIAIGFAGLIGAHEVAVIDTDADTLAPFLLATAGTLAFVVAGWMAFRMLRGR